MIASGTFLDLVRHEFRDKGSWKKHNRSRISKGWWLAYCLIIIIGAVIATTYFASRDELQLSGLWYVTMAFPYWIFFLGYGGVKKEWSNETYGWWLTLPYPRFKLIAAKWIGNSLKVWSGIVVIYILASIYVTILTLTLSHYSFSMAISFMITGINWLTMVAGFTPLIIAAGMLTISTMYSTLKPLSPVLWIVFMGGFGSAYSSIGQIILPMDMFNSLPEHQSTLYHYPWQLPVIIILSWAAAYAVIRFTGYLFEKKLDL